MDSERLFEIKRTAKLMAGNIGQQMTNELITEIERLREMEMLNKWADKVNPQMEDIIELQEGVK